MSDTLDKLFAVEKFFEFGHDLTLISGPDAGRYVYWCEGCGSILVNDQYNTHFHAPGLESSLGSFERCPTPQRKELLRDHLRKMLEADYARLKDM